MKVRGYEMNTVFAEKGRHVYEINSQWRIIRDKEAEWENDVLFSPSEKNIKKILSQMKPPTKGWDYIYNNSSAVKADLPATVEEYFTKDGKIDDDSCIGVTWFIKDIEIDFSIDNKRIFLEIESARLRKEIYINEHPAGYDIVNDTPYLCEITDFIVPGKNTIAVRITNPGGSRGWEDFFEVKWGKYSLPPSRNFGGITGSVMLIVSGETVIENVNVENINTADMRTVQISANIRGKSPVRAECKITDIKGEDVLKTCTMDIKDGTITKMINCPSAQLWNIETPVLYKAIITIYDEMGKECDCVACEFGFRIFEVKQSDDKLNTFFYFNKKRIYLKSAIDFGFYAYTGAYPQTEIALKSIKAAKELGHNSINLHRHCGSRELIKAADREGLYIYEEPGGLRGGAQGEYSICENTLAADIIIEKTRRMILRDRNSPSLIIVNICNEDNILTPVKEQAFRVIHSLSKSILITNSSGGNGGGEALNIAHMRPYEDEIRYDYTDSHTVGTTQWFDENDFLIHAPGNTGNLVYWGEVKCYCASDDSYEIYKYHNKLTEQKGNDWKGYNYSYYLKAGKKIEEFFENNSFGLSQIKSPSDISKACGYMKMYADGRNAQTIMSYDKSSGYAINAWSGGNGTEGESGWYSGMTDENRNIKGFSEIYKYYSRPLQLAIMRTSEGKKLFKPGETARFRIVLINQNVIKGGKYLIILSVKDCTGCVFDKKEIEINIKGGDTFAQSVAKEYEVQLTEKMHGGYIKIEGILKNEEGNFVTNGYEEIMLSNRKSYYEDLKGTKCSAYKYPGAVLALKEAEADISDENYDFIAAQEVPADKELYSIISEVRDRGAVLMIKFDRRWSEALYKIGILSEPVTEWDTIQSGYWNANGFGYIELPGGNDKYIGVNSWEFTSKPQGFYPLSTCYKTVIRGVHIARPDKIRILMAELILGKGRIILNPSFDIADNTPMTDLLFYEMANKNSEWKKHKNNPCK